MLRKYFLFRFNFVMKLLNTHVQKIKVVWISSGRENRINYEDSGQQALIRFFYLKNPEQTSVDKIEYPGHLFKVGV